MKFVNSPKGGFKSEDVKGFSNLPKYIPFFYPKLA